MQASVPNHYQPEAQLVFSTLRGPLGLFVARIRVSISGRGIMIRKTVFGSMDGLGFCEWTLATSSRLGLSRVVRDGDSVRIEGTMAVLGGMVRTATVET